MFKLHVHIVYCMDGLRVTVHVMLLPGFVEMKHLNVK